MTLTCERCGAAVSLEECPVDADDRFVEVYECVAGCGTGRYEVNVQAGRETRTGVLRS